MSDYPSQGTPMDVEDHPAYNKPDATQQYAGDVIQGNFPQTGLGGEINQMRNRDSIANIAKNGPKSVDTSNLARTVLRPK